MVVSKCVISLIMTPFILQCDVGNENDVNQMFEWIENNPDLGKVDICIPNAGFSSDGTLMEGQ